jgi:hypothetical protein
VRIIRKKVGFGGYPAQTGERDVDQPGALENVCADIDTIFRISKMVGIAASMHAVAAND